MNTRFGTAVVGGRRRLGRGFVLCLLLAVSALAFGVEKARAEGRERIRVVGSPVVFPLAVAAAETFSVKSRFLTPLVEGNGDAAGFALFCAGKGVQHPDIATATRRISRAELARCRQRGVSVAEIKLGHRGIVLAKSRLGAPLALTRQQIFLALAQQVPVGGQLADNPYRLWSDIDFALPVKPIQIFGPPPVQPDRETFDTLAIAPAAAGLLRAGAAPSGGRDNAAPIRLRTDGPFRETASDEETLGLLTGAANALGIVGFTFLQQHGSQIQAVTVDGVAPDAQSIADGRYGPSSPLYFYIKRENLGLIPGLADYVAELVSDAASAANGYLVRRGLIPLPPGERAALADLARRLPPLQR